MNLRLKRVRGYHKFLRKTDGILVNNPIIVCGLALPLAVVPATRLISATALVFAMLIAYLPVLMLAAAFGERVPRWLRAVIYPLFSILLLIPTRILIRAISPTITESLGVYFSLICVSTMIIAGTEFAAKNRKMLTVLRYGTFNWIGFSLVILIIAFIRELIGAKSLWGIPMPWIKYQIPGMAMAFMGFIILGFFAAFCKFIHRLIMLAQIKATGENESANVLLNETIDFIEEPTRQHPKQRKDDRRHTERRVR